jgi:hypothetical protein
MAVNGGDIKTAKRRCTLLVRVFERRSMSNALLAVLAFVIDLWLGYRAWFWVCVAFIVVGLFAVAANLMEPSLSSF